MSNCVILSEGELLIQTHPAADLVSKHTLNFYFRKEKNLTDL